MHPSWKADPKAADYGGVIAPMSWPERDADHLLVTGQQMAALEAQLFASGLPVAALMEKAALALSRRILAFKETSSSLGMPSCGVLVLVGPGHNGGDGLVVARELHLAGVPVRLWRPFEQSKPLTEQHWRHARWLGIPVLDAPPTADDPAIWIDALFGNGQTKAVGESIEALFSLRNSQANRTLVAIDLPTGLCSDSGRLLGSTAARADLTLCIGLWKQGLFQDEALAWVGRPERVDLGLPAALLSQLPAHQPLGMAGPGWTTRDRVSAPRARLAAAAGKYARGRLLVIAGSPQYAGAAHLAVAGASATGCGSIKALLPPEVARGLWMVAPHVVLAEEPPQASDWKRLDAVLVGPGLGDGAAGAWESQDLWKILQDFAGLLVLDADGLRRINQDWLRARQGRTWITPHRAEFARLFPDQAGVPALEAAAAAADRCGVDVLLKGARTVIAGSDGRRWQLLEANPGTARAGLGDVLAGYAAGLGARSMAAGTLGSVQLAVAALDHASAGDSCVIDEGIGGATPLAIAQALAKRS